MHSNTILPCPVLLAQAISIIQDLACVRLIQAGEYATTAILQHVKPRAREKRVDGQRVGGDVACRVRDRCEGVEPDWVGIRTWTRRGLKGRCLENFSLHPGPSIPTSTDIQHSRVCIHVHIQKHGYQRIRRCPTDIYHRHAPAGCAQLVRLTGS